MGYGWGFKVRVDSIEVLLGRKFDGFSLEMLKKHQFGTIGF